MNQHNALLKTIKAAITIAGIIIAVLGGLGCIFYVSQLFSSGEAVSGAAGGAALLVLGVGLGGSLAWQGSRAIRRQPSALFQPPSAWLLFLLYLFIVILGQLLISFDIWPALTFPPCHILAAAIPSLAVLAFAGRALKAAKPRWREIILQLAGGAFLSTTVGFIVEAIIGLLVLFMVVSITALTPGGLALIEELVANLQDPTWIEKPDNIMALFTFPPLLISLAVVVIFLVPLVEELAKLLGVALWSYRRPSRSHAFLWGLASGAGFALVESLFNTLAALDVWALVMVLRVGGTAMHCLGSGLMALGWQRLLVERRPWKLIGAYAISATIHGLWNMAVAGIAGLSLLSLEAVNEIILALAGSLMLFLVVFLVLLAAGIVTALVVITRRLQAGFSTSNPDQIVVQNT